MPSPPIFLARRTSRTKSPAAPNRKKKKRIIKNNRRSSKGGEGTTGRPNMQKRGCQKLATGKFDDDPPSHETKSNKNGRGAATSAEEQLQDSKAPQRVQKGIIFGRKSTLS